MVIGVELWAALPVWSPSPKRCCLSRSRFISATPAEGILIPNEKSVRRWRRNYERNIPIVVHRIKYEDWQEAKHRISDPSSENFQPANKRHTPPPPGKRSGKWDMRFDDGRQHPVVVEKVDPYLPQKPLSREAQAARDSQLRRLGGRG